MMIIGIKEEGNCKNWWQFWNEENTRMVLCSSRQQMQAEDRTIIKSRDQASTSTIRPLKLRHKKKKSLFAVRV
jgi:hypothetical protein